MPDPEALPRPWLASYPPGVPPTYTYPEVPLSRFLDDAARDFPNRVAVRFEGVESTYAELKDAVDGFAGALRDLGVEQGSHVGIALPNLPASVVASFAAFRLGAVVVHLDASTGPEELSRLLEDSRCEVLVTLTSLLPRFSLVRSGLPHLREVVATSVEDWLPLPRRLLAPALGRLRGTYRRLRPSDGAHAMTELVEEASPVRTPAPVGPGDLALVQYTGGTTGVRKGVMLTHGNLVANAFQARLWVPDVQAGRETVLCALPFWHVYGFVLGMLTGVLSAATLHLVADPTPEALLEAIDGGRPTLFPAVPTMYRSIVEHPRADRYDLSSIRACVSGAAPLAPEIIARFEQLTHGARLREGYGLSEASPLTHASPIYGRAEPGHIGLPVTDTVAVVVDPEDPTRVLEPGERGELAVHGPQVMEGYWQDPDATAAVLRDGWLLTGDIVTCDEHGVFTLVDRKKDVIFTRGRNVYPQQVEQVLLEHPGVTEAAVVGVPGEGEDERIIAHVVLLPEAPATAEELAEHCRQYLADDEQPHEIQIRDELPSSVTGKVLRRTLRTEAS